MANRIIPPGEFAGALLENIDNAARSWAAEVGAKDDAEAIAACKALLIAAFAPMLDTGAAETTLKRKGLLDD